MSGGSRGTVLVWVAVAVLGALAAWRVAGSGGGHADSPIRIDRPPGAAGEAGAPQSGGAGGGGGGRGIYVHVAGAVRRPGLIRMPAGMRVEAALDRAGGPTRRADLAGVNLAARLEDGQQIVVPAGGAPGAGGSAAGATGVKPSLGSASAAQLDQLDGIGPTLAQRIVEYRTKHGGFRSLDDLRQVEGIGEKRFEALRHALEP